MCCCFPSLLLEHESRVVVASCVYCVNYRAGPHSCFYISFCSVFKVFEVDAMSILYEHA